MIRRPMLLVMALVSVTLFAAAKSERATAKASVTSPVARIETAKKSEPLGSTECSMMGGVCRAVGPHGCPTSDRLPYACNPGVGAVCCRY